MNPRRDCEVALEDYSQGRRVQRSLPYVDLKMMVREGNWQAIPDDKHDIKYGKWTIRVKIGRCIIAVYTVMKNG